MMRRASENLVDRGPLLGALLRLAHQSIIRKVLQGLARAGYENVQSAHFAPMVALWDRPEGIRATELAARAKITKQSMGELIDQIVQRGYAERVPDPKDGRARLIRITPFGRKLSRIARQIVRDAEADWSRQVGAGRIEEMKNTLRMLLERELSA